MEKDIFKKPNIWKSFKYKTLCARNYTILNQTNLAIFAIYITALSCIILLSGCQSNEIEFYKDSIIEIHSEQNGIYPKSQHGTRSQDNGFWESWNTITLSSGQIVNTPWNPKSVTSAVPHDILEDIKYDDGWELIFYKLEDLNNGDYRANNPYLIFHNRYTGILKGFCYLSSNSFHPNNYGMWKLSIDNKPSSLFAFQNNPITKISEKQITEHYVSNITSSASHGFTIGWNCFQIELAYDPSQAGWLTISPFSSNTIELSFSGNLKADTNGLITASEKKDNGKGIPKIAGDGAENWIKEKIEDKTILGIPTSIVAKGVKSIVSWGAGSIIGAITGLFKNDNTTKSLQLTTNGTVTINGYATFKSEAGIESLKFNLDPKEIGYLGVWGLNDEPTLLFSPYAVLKSNQEYTNGYTREYVLCIVNSNVKASLTINPNVYKHIENQSIKTDYYRTIKKKFTRQNIWGTTGVRGRDVINNTQIYDSLYKTTFQIIADVSFKGDDNYTLSINQYDPPMEVFIPDVPNGPKGAISNFKYDSHFLASVGVELTLPNGSVAYSYHQCSPKIDWNLSEYNNGLYEYMYPCEPVTQLQSYGLHNQQKTMLDKQIKTTIK